MKFAMMSMVCCCCYRTDPIIFKGDQVTLQGKFLGIAEAYFDYSDADGKPHKASLKMGKSVSGWLT